MSSIDTPGIEVNGIGSHSLLVYRKASEQVE